MTVLLIGATGQIGRELVRLLLNDGTALRMLVRDKAKAHKLFSALDTCRTAEIVEGDLSRRDTLDSAMADVEQVFVSMGVISDEERAIQRSIVDAAIGRSISHFARVSVLSAAFGSLGRAQRAHAEVEDYVERSGILHTSLRPAIFDSTLLGYAKEAVKNGGWTGAAPTARNPFVSPKDVSAAALAVLQNPSLRNTVYELTGPDLLTYKDVAAKFSETIERPVEYRAVSSDHYRKLLVDSGMAHDWADVIVSRDLAGEANENGRLTSSIYDLTGRTPQSLSAYLKEQAHSVAPK